jgi:hypothetical protein
MPNQSSNDPNAAAIAAQQQQARDDKIRMSRIATEKRRQEIVRNRLRNQKASGNRKLKYLRDKGRRGNRSLINKGKSRYSYVKGSSGSVLNPRIESIEQPNHLLEYGLNILSEI